MENTEHYTSDKPINKENEDRFQRYGFAKRIAETIVSRNSKDSIVLGLFGAWGEGKSSVINFIKSEISSTSEDFIQLTFNPWRFTDEAALLTSFFNTLASEIKKSIPKEEEPKPKKWIGRKIDNWKKSFDENKEPLKTNSEAIGDLIQKYGKVVSIFGAGEAAEAIGKAISDIDIETLKSRIEKLLEESNKKIVIYIDDIDRLEKSEIHSIFRLVKLTGDFSYTSYLLSFDENMVAASIGERFGSGDKKAGENFLEKIIQVPLKIPKAQPEALKKFCFELVDKSLLINKVDVPKDDVERFVYQFSTNVLSRLNTPRLAVRYGNSLSFTIPVLHGEVNMGDLLLIEALKIFYAEHYSFVKNNPSYFIGSYSNRFDRGNNDAKIEEIKTHLDRLSENYSSEDRSKVQDLLTALFPHLNSVFSNYYYQSESHEDWYNNKRIVSTKYFDRYFSYTVIEGDISDVEFENSITNISIDQIEEIADNFKSIIDRSSPANFIEKLRSRETKLDWEASKTLSKAVCHLTNVLPREGGMMSMGFETPFGQAAIFIRQMLKHHKSEEELFAFASELMTYPAEFRFAYEINNWLRPGDRPDDKLFTDDQYVELARILTERAVEEAGEQSFYEKFPEYSMYLTHSWFERDQKSFQTYVEEYLNRDDYNIINLLIVYVPTARSTIHPEPYKTNLSKEQYEYLSRFYDVDDLWERIMKIASVEKLDAEKPKWDDIGDKAEYSNINMMRQFAHWYRRSKEEETEGNKH